MKISLRKATFSDIEFLWYLRNQPDVYQYSRGAQPIEWKEHINWIIPILLSQEEKDLFIIQCGLLPVGQIRFDYQKIKRLKSILLF